MVKTLVSAPDGLKKKVELMESPPTLDLESANEAVSPEAGQAVGDGDIAETWARVLSSGPSQGEGIR